MVTTGSRVLLVEDDAALCRSLRLALSDEDFDVLVAATAREGLARMAALPSAVLLDLGLPDADGLDVCRQMRTVSGVPIVIISARTEADDVAAGLAAGADYYLAKPFGAAELTGRVRALLGPPRRPVNGNQLDSKGWELDLDLERVSRRGRPLPLTRTEFRLLCELAAESGRPVSGRELLKGLWGVESPVALAVLEARVTSLRAKLEAHAGPVLTATASGYRFHG